MRMRARATEDRVSAKGSWGQLSMSQMEKDVAYYVLGINYDII